MTPSRKLIYAGLLAALLLAGAGCNKKPVQAAPPIAPLPVEATPSQTDAKPIEETKTETKTEPPPELVVPPPRTPTRTTPPPAKPPEPEPARPAAPTMTPRMTPQQQAALEKKTRDDISTAERNLTRVNNRPLNDAQKDMVEKIRGFLGQSRDAIRANDWVRAQNLAQKAQVLSIELVNSL